MLIHPLAERLRGLGMAGLTGGFAAIVRRPETALKAPRPAQGHGQYRDRRLIGPRRRIAGGFEGHQPCRNPIPMTLSVRRT
jgi:hypothetical protein